MAAFLCYGQQPHVYLLFLRLFNSFWVSVLLAVQFWNMVGLLILDIALLHCSILFGQWSLTKWVSANKQTSFYHDHYRYFSKNSSRFIHWVSVSFLHLVAGSYFYCLALSEATNWRNLQKHCTSALAPEVAGVPTSFNDFMSPEVIPDTTRADPRQKRAAVVASCPRRTVGSDHKSNLDKILFCFVVVAWYCTVKSFLLTELCAERIRSAPCERNLAQR